MEFLKKNYHRIIIPSISLILMLLGLIFIDMTGLSASTHGLNESFRQVKTVNNPTVFYLDHKRGLKKAYVNEKSFFAYSNKWGDVRIVSQADLDKWPDVKLVKAYGGNDIYYIKNGKKTRIASPADMKRLNFNFNDVVPISPVDLSQYQEVTNYDLGLSGSANEKYLSASYLSASPQDEFLPVGTSNNLAAIFELKAIGGRTAINSLIISARGVFNLEALGAIYITDESGVILGKPLKPSTDRQLVFNFGQDPLIIEGGYSKKIYVYANFTDYANIGNSTFYVALEKAESIKTDSKVSAVFPVNSHVFKLISSAGVLSKVRVQELDPKALTALIGDDKKIISEIRLSEITGKEDVMIKEIVLKNVGTVNRGDISDLELRDSKNRVLAKVTALSEKDEIVFSFNDWRILKNSQRDLFVTAKIKSGEGKTIDLDVRSLKAVGENYGYQINTVIYNLTQDIKIERKDLGVYSKDLIKGKAIAEYDGSVIASFEIKNDSQSIELRSLEFSLERNSDAPNLAGVAHLVITDSGEEIDNFDGENFTRGLVSIDMGDKPLSKGKTLKISLISELSQSISDNDYYRVKFNKIVYRNEDDKIHSQEVNIWGSKLVISLADVYVFSNSAAKTNYAKGQKSVIPSSFILETSAGENIIIDSVTLKRTSNSDRLSYINGFRNLKISVGSKTSAIIAEPDADSYTFENLNAKLSGGKRYELKVQADTDVNMPAQKIQLMVTNITAHREKSQISTEITNIDTSGLIVYFYETEIELSSVSGGSIKRGEERSLIGSFKIKNNSGEAVILKNLRINSIGDGISASLGYNNLLVAESESRKILATIKSPVAGANTIGLGSYQVLAGATKIFNVFVKTKVDISAQSFRMNFSDLEAYGKDSKIIFGVNGDPTSQVSVSIY